MKEIKCPRCGKRLESADRLRDVGYQCPECFEYIFEDPPHHETKWIGKENTYIFLGPKAANVEELAKAFGPDLSGTLGLFGYVHILHKGCEGKEPWRGRMELVKLWADNDGTLGPEQDPRRDALGINHRRESRVVLGLKCLTCGYVNCIKFVLYDDRIRNFATGKTWTRN